MARFNKCDGLSVQNKVTKRTFLCNVRSAF